MNLFEGQLTLNETDRCEVTTEHGIVCVGHSISGAAGMAVAVAVRPEKIQIAKERPQIHQNLFTGRVREIAYFGSYSIFIVEMPGGRSVKITEPSLQRQGSSITWEDPVFFWWDDSAPVLLTQ